MEYIKYPKIRRMYTEETDGILDGYIYIQEKLDGANSVVYLDEEGELTIGSRTRIIYSKGNIIDGFRGLVDYILNNKNILQCLKDNPTKRLHGEWLCKHSLVYPDDKYKRFWLFDISEPTINTRTTESGEEVEEIDMNFMDLQGVETIANKYSLDFPTIFYRGEGKDVNINDYAGKTTMDIEYGEGVVIKNYSFKNKFLNHCHGKIVVDKFKERNVLVFGNANKNDVELKFATSYISLARVKKIINKIEQNEDRSIQIQDTPRVCGMVYHDAFEEEMWGFIGKKTIDFGLLNRHCFTRARELFHGLLNKDSIITELD